MATPHTFATQKSFTLTQLHIATKRYRPTESIQGGKKSKPISSLNGIETRS